MRVFLLLIAALAAYGAYTWYPRDEPPKINPGLRDLKITASHIAAATTSFLGTERPGFSVSIEKSGSKTRTWVTEDSGATLEDIYSGEDKIYVEGPVKTSSKGVTAAQTLSGGSYIGGESNDGTYATILIPPMILSDDQPGASISDAANVEVEVYAHLPGWQAFSWSGGSPPESWDDIAPDGNEDAMLWTEYTDENGAIPGIELTGVNLQQKRINDDYLFASGIAAGLAAAALIAVFTEWSAIYRDKKQWNLNRPMAQQPQSRPVQPPPPRPRPPFDRG